MQTTVGKIITEYIIFRKGFTMVIIKNVFFVDAQERLRASKSCNQDEREYLGMVATCVCGRALDIYKSTEKALMPTWILSAVCTYLEKTKNNNKPIIQQDYNFYIYFYGRECFVEVETKEVVKLHI